MKLKTAALIVALTLGGCASTEEPGGSELSKLGPPQQSEDVMGGGRYVEPWLSAAVKDAAVHPIGSEQNPVRAEMPQGQRAYLGRLRCANGQPPTYQRAGNVGPGVFGSIVDLYVTHCEGSTPAQAEIYMDMYFPGHVEQRTVPGFLLTP